MRTTTSRALSFAVVAAMVGATLGAMLGASPAVALERIYLVRHAEKLEGWPGDRALDALQPLSESGVERARDLAVLLDDSGLGGVYTSETTRTIQTGLPTAIRAGVELTATDDSARNDRMAGFLSELVERHATERAVLIVGHSNTVPELLVRLGASEACFEELGITRQGEHLLIDGYDGLWTVDLTREGCAASTRTTQGGP